MNFTKEEIEKILEQPGYTAEATTCRSEAVRLGIKPSKASKYHNVRTTLGDRVFASGKEAARAGELQLLEKAGEIFGLCFQVRFPLYGGVNYIADFVYSQIIDGKLQTIVEDKKGCRTRQYIDKKKQFKTHYGIDITES